MISSSILRCASDFFDRANRVTRAVAWRGTAHDLRRVERIETLDDLGTRHFTNARERRQRHQAARLGTHVNVADVLRIGSTPAGLLLHHAEAGGLGLYEAPVGVLLQIARGVHLGLIVDHGDDRAIGKRLAGFGGGHGLRRGEQLADLLDVRPLHGGVEHAFVETLGKLNAIAAGVRDGGKADDRPQG